MDHSKQQYGDSVPNAAVSPICQEEPAVGHGQQAAVGQGEAPLALRVAEDAAEIQAGAGEVQVGEMNPSPEDYAVPLRVLEVADLQVLLSHPCHPVPSVGWVEAHPQRHLLTHAQHLELPVRRHPG